MMERGTAAPGMLHREPTLFEISRPGREGVMLANIGVDPVEPSAVLGADALRDEIAGFPELSEQEVVRHYTRLSRLNYGLDHGFYPLGSCTMKHNPKLNEDVSRLPGFAWAHPMVDAGLVPGILEVQGRLGEALCEITGMEAVTLQPSAGAHGELTGLMMIRAYHESRGDRGRKRVLIPSSAHGTNPASCSLIGFSMTEVATDTDGNTDVADLKSKLGADVAGLMITNPNTLGLFDVNIVEICRVMHEAGAQVYADGANTNAVMGKAKFGAMGVDLMHINLHKTFTQPHGGGGPGAGPVVCKRHLAPFLPTPVVIRQGQGFAYDHARPHSIGKVRSFQGSFNVFTRSLAYILTMGASGLTEASEMAVLNANYILARLRGTYHVPYNRTCMHECVLSDKNLEAQEVRTIDVAKSLMDYGFHPPTVYFPLIVKGALMIEPTETESKETIDQFCEAMLDIAERAKSDPESLRRAPELTFVGRLDETRAARQPVLCYKG
jgi:glycine cleavage system P protein (glycine dehydrogenase) subunit 2